MQAEFNFAGNPFAVLTAIVAPAVLTNASSVLSLGTSNRIARVVDRTRVVMHELAALPKDSPEYAAYLEQLGQLNDRAQFLFRALRMMYFSLGCFAASALISVLGSAMAVYHMQIGFRVLAGLGLGAGILGVGGLVAGSALMVGEVRVALAQITQESEIARTRLGGDSSS